jgi:hypothetical protein
MENWQEIVLWIIIVLKALGILVAMYETTKGTFEKKVTPFDSAYKALGALLLTLFFLSLL